MSAKNFADWAMRSRETGKITIGQQAYLSQKLFSALTVGGVLLPKSRLRSNVGVLAITSLGWWATDEILRGVNPFRRASGVVALVSILWLARRSTRRVPRLKANRPF